MSLTVTEKEHWKNRIEQRIDRRISQIESEDPAFMQGIRTEAHNTALISLGVSELMEKIELNKRREKRQQRELVRLYKQIGAMLDGGRPEDYERSTRYMLQKQVEDAIEQRKFVHEEELLGKEERGKRIVDLRREKEQLLDTIWLATSPKQIRELWSGVDRLLGETGTDLQRETLSAEPPIEQ